MCNCIFATFDVDDFSGDYDDAFACSTCSVESEEEIMMQQQEADDLFSQNVQSALLLTDTLGVINRTA